MACVFTNLPCSSRWIQEKVSVESSSEVSSLPSAGWSRVRPGTELSWSGNSADFPESEGALQELLWRQLFLDPTVWWDNRKHKKGPHFPDHRHRVSKEGLWLNSLYKFAWVDAQLVALDAQTSPTSKSTFLHDARFERGLTAETVRRLCGKGQLKQAVDVLSLLVAAESNVSDSLFYSVLKGCIAQKDLVLGQRVHDLVVRIGYESNTFLGNHILRMYASQGRMQQAREVFSRVGQPDAFMWSSIISAYAKHGEAKQAIQLYHQMRFSGVEPDCHVFVAALQACASASDLESGIQVHTDVLRSGVKPNLFVWNCLIDMYAKCGRLLDARRVFDTLPTRDVVTWTTMIDGYAEHEHGQEALSLYEEMEQQGMVVANTVTFACLLKACTGVGALAQGKQLHSRIRERGLESDIVVGNCLVDLYAKCGRLEEARKVFDRLPSKDVITWTMMINGLGQSYEGQKAIECFQKMTGDGVQANETTFTCLLGACSHEGLVKEGRQIFKAMVEEHGIMPTTEHYNCMVDLLGRAGYLEEAEKLLLSVESDDVGFTTLLNACKSHGDVERGTRCFDNLVRSKTQSASAYVLMGNLYADAGRWSDVERVARLRKSVGISKKPAVAGIEVDKHVHTFVVGEERGDISTKVRSMNFRLKEEGGHLPRTELVLKRVPEKDKEDDLCGHAEKLALAYGLLNTPGGTPLLVTKNLRMCGDCHSSTEIMSRIERREIVVRDAHRVHRFVDGYCRCAGRP